MADHNTRSTEQKRMLVDYVDKNLPPLRSTVEMIPVSHEEKELIYFHDPQGYMEKPFILDKEIAALLPLLNGNYSVRDILQELKRYGNEVNEEQLLSFIRQLDEARLLQSPWFNHYRESIEITFEKSQLRKPVCAGQSYPSDPETLGKLLQDAFSSESNLNENGNHILNGTINVQNLMNSHADSQDDKADCINPGPGKLKAVFAPHIDLRIGLRSYIPAFRSLSHIQPSRVVLLATSHYAGMFYPLYDGMPFIASRKDYETPLGIVRSDQEALDKLQDIADECGCSFQDRAHRNEHSIELHLIFLQYIWTHSFELVPILVGSLEEMYYQKRGDTGRKVGAMAAFLRENYGEDENTIFLISGDLAHVGQKFGDRGPASELFDKVKSFDRTFLESAQKGNHAELLDLMMEDYDPYRICGFPPLYTALTALPKLKGMVSSYDLWDERERESAVTYGSLLYYQNP